jgi:hypothetical protein
MYPRPPPTAKDDATNGGVQFTAARARSLRRENKENATQEREREQKPKCKLKSKPITIRRALAAANTAVMGDTLDFPSKQKLGLELLCHRVRTCIN